MKEARESSEDVIAGVRIWNGDLPTSQVPQPTCYWMEQSQLSFVFVQATQTFDLLIFIFSTILQNPGWLLLSCNSVVCVQNVGIFGNSATNKTNFPLEEEIK